MMRMPRPLLPLALTVLLGSAVPAWAQQTESWTLERAVEQALANSPRFASATHSAEAARAAARESAAVRWPTLGANATYAYTSETQEIQFDLPPLPGFTPPHIQFGDGNVYDFNLTTRAPLYAGGTLAARVQAESAAANAARWEFRGDSLRLVHEVRRAFFAALGAQARAEAARQAVRRLERHLEERRAAQAIGAASEEMIIMKLARLRQAESTLIAAEAEAEAARLALGGLVLQGGAALTPAGELDASLISDSAVPAAPLPQVEALQARAEQGRHLTRAARGSLLPSLSGTAAWHYAKPGVDVVTNEWMDYYTLGLSASWTLWDWNARTYRTRQARAAARAIAARRDDIAAAVETQRATARSAWTAARSGQAKLAERVALEHQRSAMIEGRMQRGMASESEYLDAQDDLATAELELAAATARLRLSEADLLFASGR